MDGIGTTDNWIPKYFCWRSKPSKNSLSLRWDLNGNLLVTEEPPADTEAGVDQVDEGEGGQQQAEVE